MHRRSEHQTCSDMTWATLLSPIKRFACTRCRSSVWSQNNTVTPDPVHSTQFWGTGICVRDMRIYPIKIWGKIEPNTSECLIPMLSRIASMMRTVIFTQSEGNCRNSQMNHWWASLKPAHLPYLFGGKLGQGPVRRWHCSVTLPSLCKCCLRPRTIGEGCQPSLAVTFAHNRVLATSSCYQPRCRTNERELPSRAELSRALLTDPICMSSTLSVWVT